MTVVIAGRPNAGKSSLLNALAGREAAIVTDIAGTTRYVLREHIHLDGMPLHVVDTAGCATPATGSSRSGSSAPWMPLPAPTGCCCGGRQRSGSPDPQALWPELLSTRPPLTS